jgi:hypothetical protein
MKVSLFAVALAAVAGFSSADKASFFYGKSSCSGTPDEVVTMPGCYALPGTGGQGSAFLECTGGKVKATFYDSR